MVDPFTLFILGIIFIPYLLKDPRAAFIIISILIFGFYIGITSRPLKSPAKIGVTLFYGSILSIIVLIVSYIFFSAQNAHSVAPGPSVLEVSFSFGILTLVIYYFGLIVGKILKRLRTRAATN